MLALWEQRRSPRIMALLEDCISTKFLEFSSDFRLWNTAWVLCDENSSRIRGERLLGTPIKVVRKKLKLNLRMESCDQMLKSLVSSSVHPNLSSDRNTTFPPTSPSTRAKGGVDTRAKSRTTKSSRRVSGDTD
ncbi:hypothetical protein JTE90_001950 [Oedothorax gibbosus]|uniref:Uncharacterized protein n=1 Tax=Oedothorax gibbosus TaxID=931172 RepID=A0AAV6VWB2_9ARAC|nr:hypothetical protein JTE90_001950 [Oedothorax gibbosus]